MKRWAQNTSKPKLDDPSENSNDSNEDNQIWIKSILSQTVDKIFEEPTTQIKENEQLNELNELTKELYEKWNNLKVKLEFRIYLRIK